MTNSKQTSILDTLEEDFKFLFFALSVSLFLYVISVPIQGVLYLVGVSVPEWSELEIGLFLMTMLVSVFWDTISAIFKSIKGVFK